jgi:hypothetical protein
MYSVFPESRRCELLLSKLRLEPRYTARIPTSPGKQIARGEGNTSVAGRRGAVQVLASWRRGPGITKNRTSLECGLSPVVAWLPARLGACMCITQLGRGAGMQRSDLKKMRITATGRFSILCIARAWAVLVDPQEISLSVHNTLGIRE